MRRGVTLLEVLISILIASVGLLGAIAVFPVALSQARKGKIADTTAVAGKSAIASFQVQGFHNRQRWLAWDQTNQQQVQVPADFQRSNSPYFGQAFCIDPALFAHNAADDPANGNVWAYFPAVPQTAASVRMTRLNLTSGNPAIPLQPMGELQADFAFRISDELLYERPADESLPAAQLFTNINGQPGRRQEEGRLTWFATLVPRVERFQRTDSSNVAELGDEYVLSVVVCRDRASGESLHVNDPAAPEHPWNEWTAEIVGGTASNLNGDWHSGGIGGGEVTITTNDPSVDATFNDHQYVSLKSGQWVLLSREIPGSVRPIQHHQWYRVSDAGETTDNGNRWSQDVSLIGGDWPADLITTTPQWDNILEGCDVTIMPTVVHVYERTILIGR